MTPTVADLCTAALAAPPPDNDDALWVDLHRLISTRAGADDFLQVFLTALDHRWPLEIVLAAARRAEKQGHNLEVRRRLGPLGVGLLCIDRRPHFVRGTPPADFGVPPDPGPLFDAVVQELNQYDAFTIANHASSLPLAQEQWLLEVWRRRRLPEHYLPSTLGMLERAEHDYRNQTLRRRAFISAVLCVARAPGVDTRIGALVDAALFFPEVAAAAPGFFSAMLGDLHGLDLAFGVLGLLVSLAAIDPSDPRLEPIAEWLLRYLDGRLVPAAQTYGPVVEGGPFLLQCQSDPHRGWAWWGVVRERLPKVRRPVVELLMWRLVYDRPWRGMDGAPPPRRRERSLRRPPPKC